MLKHALARKQKMLKDINKLVESKADAGCLIPQVGINVEVMLFPIFIERYSSRFIKQAIFKSMSREVARWMGIGCGCGLGCVCFCDDCWRLPMFVLRLFWLETAVGC